jgi:PAS domain S-box-containing protein
MGAQGESLAEEISRLRRSVNDMTSVVALPAVWAGGDASQIARTLSDALLGMLGLEFVSVRLHGAAGEAGEVVSNAPSPVSPEGPRKIVEAVDSWMGTDPRSRPGRVGNPLRDGEVSLFALPLGSQADIGVLVAASRRADFPNETERLVLSVAANEAVIGVREARLRREKERIAEELHRRVAERTADLASANDVLRKEIAERRRIEGALRASELEARLIVENIPAQVSLLAPDGEVAVVTRRMLDYSGKTLDELSRWRSGDVVHPEDLPRAVASFTKAIEAGEPYDFDHRWRRHDGVYRWFRALGRPMRDAEGRVVRWCCALIDVDDRVRSEEELRTSEANLKLIINTIPALAWSFRTDGYADFFNQHYLDYTGLSADEAEGWRWTAAVHPEDRASLAAAWDAVRTSGKPGEVEARLRRFDDEFRWFLFRANPLRDPEGNIVKWYGTVVDMHDWKEAQEQLRSTQTELARASRVAVMGELTASIAHEVSQPLAGILTNASAGLRMLAAEPPNLEGARETARRTIRDANRASDVISRLRALFGRHELTVEALDLSDAAREVIALVSSELREGHVVLRPELADDLPTVLGDRVQLQQVILNLLRNASEAMSEVHDRPRLLVIRTEREPGDRVRLAVKDAGVGIEPGAAARLFEPFYTTKPTGMGIGLSVSRSIIDGHRGRIWAEPNAEEGATFAFSLALGPSSEAE